MHCIIVLAYQAEVGFPAFHSKSLVDFENLKKGYEMNIVNTPYDDVFRTLLNDCSELIIPVVNEVFGENYTGKEEIIFAQNEHFLNQQDGKENKCITDSHLAIVGATETK